MCAGALINARIGRLVYGAAAPKGGATATLYNVCADPRLNHNPPVTVLIKADEANNYGAVRQVLTELHAAKITRIALLTQEETSRR